MVWPVTRAHIKMASAAILNRIPAAVKTPMPEKASFMATALEPKITHKNADKTPAKMEKSGLSKFALFIATVKKLFQITPICFATFVKAEMAVSRSAVVRAAEI